MSENSVKQRLFIWFVGSLICLLMEGSQAGSFYNGMVNAASFTTQSQNAIVQAVVMAGTFFSLLLSRLILWDYSFLAGGIFGLLRIGLIVVFGPSLIYGIYIAGAWVLSKT